MQNCTLFWFAALLTIPWTCCCQGDNATTSDEPSMSAQTVRRARKLHLLALLPFPDDRPGLVPLWDGGLDIVPALELAKEQINNNSDILEGYELDLVFEDSGCNVSVKAANAFIRHIFSEQDKQIVGIIGPACAPSTVLVSPISGRPQIALVNIHLAATLNIEDRTVQPYSIGIGATFSVFVDAVFALMKQNNWRQVAALYQLGPLRIFHKDFQRFKQIISTEVEGGRLLYSSPVKDDYLELPLEDVKNTQTRLVLAFTNQFLAHKIMCLAYHERMIYPVYQWIVQAEDVAFLSRPINVTSEEFETDYNCTEEDMRKALNGTIVLSPAKIPLDLNAPTVSGISYSQYSQEYQKRVDEYNSYEAYPGRNISSSEWGAFTYDAVWAMALALDKAGKQGDLNLTTYRPGQSSSTLALRDQIHQLDFDGISGRISFNPDTGFVVRSVNIFQALYGRQNNLGYYTDHNQNITFLTMELSSFINDSFPERTVTLRLEVATVLLSLILIQLVLIVAAHVMSTVYSKYRTIKASSPRLKHLLFVGCYVIIASDLLLITLKSFNIEKKVQGDLCHIIWGWLFGTGFVVCLGTLSVRSWRLYRIFVHTWNPGSFLSDSKLITCVLLLVLISVVFSIVWTAVAPYNAITDKTETVEAGMRIVMLGTTCNCKKKCFMMFSIELGYLGFILLTTVTLTFLTRNIERKNFSTISLRVLVYLLVVVLLAGFPGHFLLNIFNEPVWAVVVICLTLNMVTLLFLIFDFASPLMPLMKEIFCSYKQSGKYLTSPKIGVTRSNSCASPPKREKSFIY